MAAEEITVKRYRCTCNLPKCPGKGQPWLSKEDKIPTRCKWCGRYTWNGKDKKSPVRRQIMDAALASGATAITITSTDASGKTVSAPLTIALPVKKDKPAKRRAAITLPKPRKVRSTE